MKPGMDNAVTRYLASKTFTSELQYKETLVHSQVGRMEKIAVMPNRNIRNNQNRPNSSLMPQVQQRR